VDILFDKLYRYDRIKEHCSIAVPVKQGVLTDIDGVQILKEGNALPIQKKITSRHKDGSVRYMFLRFMADLPANAKTKFDLQFNSSKLNNYEGIKLEKTDDGFFVDSGRVSFVLKNDSQHLFETMNNGGRTYTKEQLGDLRGGQPCNGISQYGQVCGQPSTDF
jgi:hypothetical protein